MDHQDEVCDRYPAAQAVEEPLIFRHGDTSPIEPSHWEIFAGPDQDDRRLGSGKTEEKAWADAARRSRVVSFGFGPARRP
jgi:hypothetical protein